MPKPLCPICSAENLTPFFYMPNVPVFNNVLWPDAGQAKNCARGNIRLAVCENCGFITNTRFDERLLEYAATYENSLHFSGVFQNYATALAAELIERYDLHQKTIVEIGAGQGDFLRLLCDLGNNRGIGFDPAHHGDGSIAGENGHLRFIRDRYSKRYAHYQADLFCCRHVLEHIAQPQELLATIKDSINGNSHAALYFEVPNSAYTIDKLAVWDIIYEHCSYFTAASLERTFSANGFKVEKVTTGFNDQYLSVYAAPNSHLAPPQERTSVALPSSVLFEFQRQAGELIDQWNQRLDSIMKEWGRVVLWGAGSKGVTFLNIVEKAQMISHVVDINPRKHGHFVAGTGQRIIAPDELADIVPDVVILANPAYHDEVKNQLHQLNLQPEILSL